MSTKKKNERLSIALKKNLKKESFFKKKLKRRTNNVSSFGQMDKKNV